MTCGSLDEVRAEIDRIDDAIIRLIAERGAFVAQAARFKKDADGVRDAGRVERVIQRVRAKAAEYGADEDMAEALYREMIRRFVSMEMRAFDGGKNIREAQAMRA